MSQHDYVLDNQSGANFRSDINNAFQAIVTHNSGNAEPTTTYPFMFWPDTSGASPLLKQRNAANNAWIIVGDMSLPYWGLQAIAYGTAPSAPQPYQFWVDTSGANPILKERNGANNAWVTIGRTDIPNFGLLPLTGGTMSGAIAFSNTDYTYLPGGTTAQRPGSPAAGMIRYNTDLVAFEGYNGTAWAPIGGGGYVVTTTQSITAGGTITTNTTDQRQLRYIQGNAASVSASVTPFGTGGGWKDGTEIKLIGVDDANSVIISNNDAAKGCVGNFSSIEITRFKVVKFVYSSALDRFILTYQS